MKPITLATLEGYLRGGFTKNPKINEGVALLQSLTESHRLVVSDFPYFVDDLSKVIANLEGTRKNWGYLH